MLLVDGATRMPSVRQFLKNMAGEEPLGVDGDGMVRLARRGGDNKRGWASSTSHPHPCQCYALPHALSLSLPLPQSIHCPPLASPPPFECMQPGSKGVDPDEAVALGAAVQAGVLQGEVKGMMVMDQWQVCVCVRVCVCVCVLHLHP